MAWNESVHIRLEITIGNRFLSIYQRAVVIKRVLGATKEAVLVNLVG